MRAEEAGQWQLDGRTVACLLRRSSARRTLAMRVDGSGRVVVNLPLRAPVAAVEEFLARHADWLRAQLLRARQDTDPWREGGKLPFLGGSLRLTVDSGTDSARREGDRLLVPDLRRAPDSVPVWYRAAARPLLGARLSAICRGLGRVEPAWRLSDARTRWGSLSVKGVVGLNWRLVKAGPAEIDYVICHELAHFRQRNHSAAFWREVAALCPGYPESRRRLRQNGPHYFQF